MSGPGFDILGWLPRGYRPFGLSWNRAEAGGSWRPASYNMTPRIGVMYAGRGVIFAL